MTLRLIAILATTALLGGCAVNTGPNYHGGAYPGGYAGAAPLPPQIEDRLITLGVAEWASNTCPGLRLRRRAYEEERNDIVADVVSRGITGDEIRARAAAPEFKKKAVKYALARLPSGSVQEGRSQAYYEGLLCDAFRDDARSGRGSGRFLR